MIEEERLRTDLTRGGEVSAKKDFRSPRHV